MEDLFMFKILHVYKRVLIIRDGFFYVMNVVPFSFYPIKDISTNDVSTYIVAKRSHQ